MNNKLWWVLIFLFNPLLGKETEFTNVNNEDLKIGIQGVTSKPLGMNLKLSPAFFWKTLLLEMEFALHPHLTIGLNLHGKLGGSVGKRKFTKDETEAYNQPGYAAEIAFKYYFKGEVPEGIYLQLNAGYSTLFFYDGNTRPYTLHNHWRKNPGGIFEKPLPYYAGLGIGYQVIILPERFIGNVMLGIQGNKYKDNSFPLSFYIAPSLGFKF